MALVIGKANAETYLTTNLAVKNGQKTTIELDGKKYMDVVKYEKQEAAKDGATVLYIDKPFLDFAVECGPKGAMTADKIIEKFPNVERPVAEALAAEFGVFHDNYVIVPDTCMLCMTLPPVNSISDLFIPQEPVEAAEEELPPRKKLK